MLFLENIKLALTAIRVNKMRSFLTMLGIIIGISSVISITAIGASAQAVISKEFESIGAAYMFIMPNWEMIQDGIMPEDLITQDEMDALKERFPDDIRYIAPSTVVNSKTKIGRQEAELQLVGVGADYNQFYKGLEIVHGRMVNKGDVSADRDSLVIDIKAARFLFGKENVVGKTVPGIVLGTDRDLTIVGVYDVRPSLLTQLNTSRSYTCYVPYSMLMNADEGTFYAEIYANPEKSVSDQGEAFSAYLCRIKDKDPGFYRVESAESQLSMINTVLGTLSVALGAIAAISLLVGGIGIMNIMLVSVTERTREIGIRKSLGARTKDILTQFLIEAMILSSIGGIIGTITGISLAGLGMMAFGIDVVIQPLAVVIAVVFAAGVGMFFGLFPARKAAKLDPIEALRYE